MSCRRFMIDIEGLGKMPGEVILSIGWCRFGPDGPRLEESGEVRLEIQPQLNQGLKVDGETLDWWLHQTALPWDPGRVAQPPYVALNMFNHAVRGADEIWAKPPQYDLVGIQAAMRVFNVRQSWGFRAERCFRTLLQTAPDTFRLPPLEEGTKHGALVDAIHQAEEAARILRWAQSGFPEIP